MKRSTYLQNRIQRYSAGMSPLSLALAVILPAVLASFLAKLVSQHIMNSSKVVLQKMKLYAFQGPSDRSSKSSSSARDDANSYKKYQFLMDFVMEMIGVPKWLLCWVKVRKQRLNLMIDKSDIAIYNSQSTIGSESDELIPTDKDKVDGTIATIVDMDTIYIPCNPKELLISRKGKCVEIPADSSIKGRVSEGFSAFTSGLLTQQSVHCKIKSTVDLWILGFIPIFGLQFEPELEIGAMMGFKDTKVLDVQILNGTSSYIEICTKVSMFNPSKTSLEVGQAWFNLYFSDDPSDTIVGSVYMENLNLEPGENILHATVLFHPPKNHRKATEILAGFLTGKDSSITIKPHSGTLTGYRDENQGNTPVGQPLTFLSDIMEKCLVIHTFLPGWHSPLIEGMNLHLSPFQKPVNATEEDDDQSITSGSSKRISGGAQFGLKLLSGMVFGQEIYGNVVINNKFGDWIRITKMSGSVYLSEETDDEYSSESSEDSPNPSLIVGKIDLDASRDSRARVSSSGEVVAHVLQPIIDEEELKESEFFAEKPQSPSLISSFENIKIVRSPSRMDSSTPSDFEESDKLRFLESRTSSRLSRPPFPESVISIDQRSQIQPSDRSFVSAPEYASTSHQTHISQSTDWRKASKEPLAEKEYIMAVPPYSIAISPNLPVKMVLNSTVLQVLKQAAKGELCVDVHVTLGCMIGNMQLVNLPYCQKYIPVEVD